MGTGERRGTERTPIRIKVDCHHEGNYLISYSKDISPDGIFLCTQSPVAVGSSVTLAFSVEGLHEVAVTATVVWTPTPGSKAERGMGLQFVDLPDVLREALLELIHRVAVLDEMECDSGPYGTA